MIQRLLFVADAAVSFVEELPPAVRDLIDAADEVYVVTPSLPGRLAWLADEVDRPRHVADERLDTVLGHVRSIRGDVSGAAGRGSILTVIGDAVAEFEPDHILLALRDSEHANWQEHGLVERIEERFGLLVTSYAVDVRGHTPTADGPVLLCYDGSEDATYAIQRAAELLTGRRAVVVTVWRPAEGLGSFAWSGATATMVNFFELDRAAAEDSARVADEGARIARDEGLEAESIAVEATGPVWKAIVELADRRDAATIVLGSRGRTGLRSTLLGSVSSAVLHHAARPTLVIRHPVAVA
jgi:nucleotide-binding universal stress UspA family protein